MTAFLFLMMLLAGFPRGDTTDYMMITPYIIHGDLAEPEGAWYALFETDSVYELRTVEIFLTLDEPPSEDWERPAGFIVGILNETEKPLIIVSSSKTVFTEGPVSTALHDYQHMSPDTSIILHAPGVQETRLFTTIDGLFLSDDEICQWITDTPPGIQYSGNSITIVWAGDIDRDGVIDLIVNDVNDGYVYFEWKLYLSSEAGDDSIVRMVASYFDVYY